MWLKDSQKPYTPKDKLYYALLSGENKHIAIGELESLLESVNARINLLYPLETLALINTNAAEEQLVRIARQSGYIRETGVSITLAPEDPDRFPRYVENKIPPGVYWIVYEKHMKPEWNPGQQAIIKTIVSANKHASYSRNGMILKVDHYPGFIHLGIRLEKKNYTEFISRLPRRRPVFRPGTLDPILSRSIVNLSRPLKNTVYLDPFCGVGGFAIEAGLVGFNPVLCGDVDYQMMKGAIVNLKHYVKGKALVCYYGDARKLPLKDNSVDRIVTDPPYGRTTSTRGVGRESIIRDFLREAWRVLKPGGFLVYAYPAEVKPRNLAGEAGFMVVGYYEMHVHRGLVRTIVVARKPLAG